MELGLYSEKCSSGESLCEEHRKFVGGKSEGITKASLESLSKRY